MAANLYIQTTYGAMYGASAIAGNRLASFLLGVAFPLFTIQSAFLMIIFLFPPAVIDDC